MKATDNRRYKTITALIAVTILVLTAAVAGAQVGGNFDLSWNSVDGGGATASTGGPWSLGGTIGQPDASGVATSPFFAATTGFWAAALVTPVPTSTSTPTRTRTATSTPTNTPIPILVGHVTWQGPPAQPNTRQQQPITLTLKSSTTERNFPVQTTDASGFFTVPVTGLPNGTYSWRAKGTRHLATANVVVLAGAAQTNLEMGLQLTGDANNDNLVGIGDFNILRTTFGKSLGDPGYDARADFDNSNSVTISDFNLLKANTGLGGAPPIVPGLP